MKKTYVEPICQMDFMAENELLTLAGSGEYIAWDQGVEEVFGA